MAGQTVTIAKPWQRGGLPLFKAGKTWLYLERDNPLPADWIEGARQSKRRQQSLDRAVREMAKIAPPIDALEVGLRKAARRRPLSIPARPFALDSGAQLAALADGHAQTVTRAGELTEAQRARLIQDRETEALLRQDKANAA